MSGPLITFALFAYKQENYIREAVEAVLAQTYSPLEILISDDCSPDRTFTIIKETVAGYSGPHQIVINRNPQNLGLGEHVNLIGRMARGEWIITAAGDDISLPERAAVMGREIIQNPALRAIGCNYERINKKGERIARHIPLYPRRCYTQREVLQINAHMFYGCVMAYHRDCWDRFPPLHRSIPAEDNILSLRAALLGQCLMVDESLVRYRAHDESITSAGISTSRPADENPLVRHLTADTDWLVEQRQLSHKEADEFIRELRRYANYLYDRNQLTSASSLYALIRSNRHLSIFKDWNLIRPRIGEAFRRLKRAVSGRLK